MAGRGPGQTISSGDPQSGVHDCPAKECDSLGWSVIGCDDARSKT